MQIFFIKFLKKFSFLFIKLIRIFTNKFDKRISLILSKTNWSSELYTKGLEITTTVGCAMMCNYCPQENYKKSGKDYPRVLTLEAFKSAIKNVDNSFRIHWTGFSEPLHCKDFTQMSDFCYNKGHKQHISTTMFGREECKEYMFKYNVFDSVAFHLPDNQNLMHLKVNDKYLDYLEKAITFQAKNVSKKKFTIMVIGNDFEIRIRNLINELLNKKIIFQNQIYIRQHLVTRANQVDDIDGFKKNTIKKIETDTNKLFYCGYGRLNKGVMLTNGSLAICCNDYSIEHNVGSLINSKLKNLYEHKELFLNEDFIRGEKLPCKNCEFYESL